MREFDYLPYERAVEQMAREYAKIRPSNPLDQDTSPEPSFRDFRRLENTYCYNLEILMLIRQLKSRVTRKEVIEHLDSIYDIKTEISKREEKIYFSSCGKYPPTPAIARLSIPNIMRRLLYLQTIIMYDIKNIETSYKELQDIFEAETQASIILDNIIIIITNL